MKKAIDYLKPRVCNPGMALGAAIGLAIGIALDNIALGVALGAAVSIPFSANHCLKTKTARIDDRNKTDF
ncbi:MAG: hypothetical protein R3F48_13855 [Candidatus Zixiibacteriota bacterium]